MVVLVRASGLKEGADCDSHSRPKSREETPKEGSDRTAKRYRTPYGDRNDKGPTGFRARPLKDRVADDHSH